MKRVIVLILVTLMPSDLFCFSAAKGSVNISDKRTSIKQLQQKNSAAAASMAVTSTAKNATKGAAITVPVATNQKLSAEQIAKLSIMGKVKWLQEHPSADGYNERYCNTMIALRGMVHNHPDLKIFAKTQVFFNSNNSCEVATSMACHAKGGSTSATLAKVVTSLEETPLATPAGCDGTTCGKLIDKSKKYLDICCFHCSAYHYPNEYCHCKCVLSLSRKTPAVHDNPKCSNCGELAVVWVDGRVAYELELRELEKVNAEYRKKQKEKFEPYMKEQKDYWDKQATEFVKIEKKRSDKRAKIEAEVDAKIARLQARASTTNAAMTATTATTSTINN